MGLFPKTVDSQFLIRVIKNEVSSEEKEFFESWLNESEANKEEFGSLVLLWDKAGKSAVLPIPDSRIQWGNIKERIKPPEKPKMVVHPAVLYEPDKNQKGPEPFIIEDMFKRNYTAEILSWTVKIAAVFVLVFASITYYNRTNTVTSVPAEIVNETALPVKMMKLITQKGERKTLPLSDGSIIYLNADSKVTFPSTFSQKQRIVALSGEAYFSIKKDPNRPFKVITGSTSTEVTGTEFNIKYRNDKFNLVVTKGSVKAKDLKTPNEVFVESGKMVTASKTIGLSIPVKVNIDDFIAWRKNKLSFQHSTLFEVMNEIETYYNVKVVFNIDSLKRKTLTGVFNTNSLDDVLSMISLSMDVQIKRDGKKIIVN